MQSGSRWYLHGSLGVALAASLALGCSDDSDGNGNGNGDTGVDTGADAGDYMFPDDCTHQVTPSGPNQTPLRELLIEGVSEGDIVCLAPGVYGLQSQLDISADGITVRGAGMGDDPAVDTIFDGSTIDMGANGIRITGDNVTLQDLRMENTPGDGIRADDVTNIAFIGVTVWWDADQSDETGAYGLYPVGSEGVLIDGCLVKGARDAGIYVGQSSDVLVTRSEAWGNVAGIEIENTVDAEVVDNYAHDNTAGILVFNLPGPPVQGGERTLVHNNRVENNNVPNFGIPGTIVAVVPHGIGIVLLASDNNEFRDNTISGNESTGFLILTYLPTLYGSYDNPDFEQFSEGNWIHDNTFENNGTNPSPMLTNVVRDLPSPVPDIVYDGCHDDLEGGPTDFNVNCVSDNGDATYLDIAMCGGDRSDDIAAVTCEYTSLPSQDGVVD